MANGMKEIDMVLELTTTANSRVTMKDNFIIIEDKEKEF